MTSRPIPLLLVALLLLSSLAPLASAGEAWTKETGSAITAVATDERGDLIFVGTESGMLYCYNSAGNEVWSQTLPSGLINLESSAGGEYVLVERAGRVELRDGSTGSVITGESNANPQKGRIAPHTGAFVYLQGSLDHIRLRDSSGNQWWATPWLGYTISDVAVSGDASWVTTASGSNLRLYGLILPNPDDWLRSGTWAGYHKRIAHTIVGSTDGALTNYPVEITVIRGAGSSSGSTVYAPECRADFADIRFTAADGVTQIPYYLESVVGNTATFLVNVPSIPASPGMTTIYVYWENPAVATTTSDPAAADYPVEILLYDDFNDGVIDGNWTVSLTDPTQGTATEAGGYLELYSRPTFVGNLGKVTVTGPNHNTPIRIEVQANTVPTAYTHERVRLFSPGAECPMISKDPGHTTHQLYLSDWTGTAATVGSYITHNIYINATHTRWVAGSDWDITTQNGATPMRATFITGDREWPWLSAANTVYGTLHLDEITVYRWVGPGSGVEPTHGAWGPVESIVTPLDTKTLDGTIIDIDAPETGDWVAVSTTTKTYIIEITDSGFGTVYSADRTGTPYAVAIANNGANTIEGRGILADIFRFDGAQTGTYTAGGPVRTVAIAQKNGLYAAAGSDDGKYYIFSKDESSSWYLLHASDSEDPVTAIAMSWRGEIAVIGRADGSVVLYTTTDAPPQDSQMTIYTIKDGQPYIGKPVSVSTADVSDPDKWTPLYNNLRTDSDGKIVISTHTGHYYQININNGEKIVVIQASSATPIHSVVFRSPLIYEKYSYDVQYNASSQAIEMTYADNEGPATVSWSIVRTDTYSEVYSHTTSGATTATATYPVSEPDISYKVNVKVQRSSGGNIQNMWFITPQNASPIALPFWDENIQNAVFIVFLMILGGVFYYSTGAKGALIVALVAALFRYFDWITVPWFWVIAAVVFAFLANIAEGA